jgi:acyl phosphate:glycerol-3-phosphate acyltransferase
VPLAGLLIFSYLVGAFPSAIVYGRVFHHVDIRDHGSGNAGGTNAWRVLGWRIGLPVIVTDVAKSAIAAGLISRIPIGPLPVAADIAALLCGLAAIVGHVFPVYTGFRGGKGVAAGAGMLLVTASIPAGLALGVFALSLFAFGRVSLGSMLAAISLPFSVFFLNRFTTLEYSLLLQALTIILAVFIVYTHRTNLVRLVHGQEKGFTKLQLWKRILRPRP